MRNYCLKSVNVVKNRETRRQFSHAVSRLLIQFLVSLVGFSHNNWGYFKAHLPFIGLIGLLMISGKTVSG